MIDTILIALSGGSGTLAVLNWRETKRDRTKGKTKDVRFYRRIAVAWLAVFTVAVIGATQ